MHAETADRLHFQMLSFSVDPQWCGLLFSIYWRHERVGALGADALATCSAPAPPLHADWIAFAGSVGFELCQLSSSWALVLETVKASGVILLLGIGGFVCYKLYHYYRPNSRSRSPNSSPPHSRYKDRFLFYRVGEDNQLIEDLDDEDISSIEGRYFGPSPAPSKNNLRHGIDVAAYLRKSKFFCNHQTPSSSHSESGASCDENREASSVCVSPCGIGQLASWSANSRRLSRESSSPPERAEQLMKRLRTMLPQQEEQNSQRGFTSLPVTPGKKFRHKVKERKANSNWEEAWKFQGISREERKSLCQDGSPCSAPYMHGMYGNNSFTVSPQSRMVRDESFDSLGFSKRLPREGSFDSTCSELSFDFSFPEATAETSTMMCLENLQEEIDQLKNSCLMMDEEFVTIKCNRNLPGMSSLMNVGSNNTILKRNDASQESLKEENARACFAGLYSLTTIKNSTSSELSDSLNANGRASVGSAESLAWDSPISVASPVRMPMDDIQEDNGNSDSQFITQQTPETEEGKSAPCQLKLMNFEGDIAADLEWDEEGLECSGLTEETDVVQPLILPDIGSLDTRAEEGLEVMSSKELSTMIGSMMSTTSSVSDRSLRTESGFESKFTNSSMTISSDQFVDEWNQLLPSMSRSESVETNCCELDYPQPWREETIEMNKNEFQFKNIGEKINVIEYAEKEWKGETPRAHTMLRAYSAIPSLLGMQYIRTIRGDNYCGIRAAIFQILSKGYSLPNLEELMKCVQRSQQHTSHVKWLCEWNFAGRLNYGQNVLYGMKSCLQALKYVATELASKQNKAEYLAAMLNQNPQLDVHVMEAVKIIMLFTANELHLAKTQEVDVPMHAELLFARDSSETPRDFMNNYLMEVGNKRGLEQDKENIEMCLLGYAFKTAIRVVRPFAYGSDDFVTCYPDDNLCVWREIELIAEDDRHYNILVE